MGIHLDNGAIGQPISKKSLQTFHFLLQSIQDTGPRLVNGPPRDAHFIRHMGRLATFDGGFPEHSPAAGVEALSQKFDRSASHRGNVATQLAGRLVGVGDP